MSRVHFNHNSTRLASSSLRTPIRILFVDDEQRLLDGLRRSLRGQRKVWDMHFINGGGEALSLLGQERFDVVVSDLSMPGVDGFKVLEYVKEHQPDCIRIILSGNADVASVVRTIGPSHQFLSKPCTGEQLEEVVNRAMGLRRLLADSRLKQLVGGVENLPTLPKIYEELCDIMQSDQVDLRRVGELVGQDVALTSKVLKLVNSAFFGMRRRIYDPAEAASVLGLETLQSLVLASHTFDRLGTMLEHFDVEAVWGHCLRVGTMTKAIGQHEGLPHEQVEGCYLAGLMHDTGRLVMARALLASYDRVCAVVGDGRKLAEIEKKAFGADHGEVGAYLLGLWGCSDFIVEGIAFHHQPSGVVREGFSSALAVHFADAMDRKISYGIPLNDSLEVDFLKDQGHLKQIAPWQDVCGRCLDQLEQERE